MSQSPSPVELARAELAAAREKSERLWDEYHAFTKTLDPTRGVAGDEELRRLGDASEWTGKAYRAEEELFKAENGTPCVIGEQGDYRWLSSLDCSITSLLRLCPEVVVEKYIAVTSIDSGALRLTEEEKTQGWWTRESGIIFRCTPWGDRTDREDWRVAYSPRIQSIHGLPNETHTECCDGYAEWYVFDQPVASGEIESFVNYSGFRLFAPEYKDFAARFWDQMMRLRPESYLAEGTVLTFATRNSAAFDQVVANWPQQLD